MAKGSAPGEGRDGGVSPLTGWTRRTWVGLADRLLLAARPWSSSGHARVTPPGPEGGYGHDVDGLEGFARTFLLAGFRLAGDGGADPLGLADWYARGIDAGTDPSAPDRWVRLDEHPQAKVEAASIALILDMTRPWIWDRLDPEVQERVIAYLAPAVGDDTYPRINWVWFRLVVQTFLRSVGGPYSLDEMRADLATHDSFRRADGWLADGEKRAFDHYTGWALHLYPTLWARMAGAADLASERSAQDRELLDRYLVDAIHLVGADGAPLIQGRSLIYRFAAAAPFWVGAMAEVPSVSPGLLRRAASGIVAHFAAHGVPDAGGQLTTGWFGPWPALAQSYSGPGSPYWASKGMLGLALPADHPVWTAVEEPLPVERADTLRAVRAPGWIVSGTRDDGIVRVVNHGNDHATPGESIGDSPLYARIGYSTATFPLLDADSWENPLDQSVTLLDVEGHATHRTGMEVLEVTIAPGTGDDADRDARAVGLGAVRIHAHWLAPDPVRQGHGYGLTGTAAPAAELTVVSLVRGAYEVRLIRLDEIAPGADAVTVRDAGWPITGDQVCGASRDGRAEAIGAGLTSSVTVLLGAGTPGIVRREDAAPLGRRSVVPMVERPVSGLIGAAAPGGATPWTADLIALTGAGAAAPVAPPSVVLGAGPTGPVVTVGWPDGVRTTSTIELQRPRDRQPDAR